MGAATPSAARTIFAVLCYVAAAIQLLGFIGVAKVRNTPSSADRQAKYSASQENVILLRRYITLHIMITVATFSVAAVWIILSATRHSTAKRNCIDDFFQSDTTSSEGDTMCNIFPWVDIGLMAGLWVLLAVSQVKHSFYQLIYMVNILVR